MWVLPKLGQHIFQNLARAVVGVPTCLYTRYAPHSRSRFARTTLARLGARGGSTRNKIYELPFQTKSQFAQESSITFCFLRREIDGALVAFTFTSVANSDLWVLGLSPFNCPLRSN